MSVIRSFAPNRPHPFLLLLLLLWLSLPSFSEIQAAASGGAATGVLHNRATTIQETKESHFQAIDVYYDELARHAIGALKNEHELPEKQKLLLESCGNANQVTLTLRGDKGRGSVNQDRSLLVVGDKDYQMLLGVLDGHGVGGEIVSEYARQEIPKRLSSRIQQSQMESNNGPDSEAMSQLLHTLFVDIDKDIPTITPEGGTTASIVLLVDNLLYIANVGDSVSFVAYFNTMTNEVEVVYTTREDKPDLPAERARIEGMGGKVFLPGRHEVGETSRVLYDDPATGLQSGLAMSRSIGDNNFIGVIADPTVDVLDVDQIVQDVRTLQGPVCTGGGATAPQDGETCQNLDAVETPDWIKVFAVSITDGLADYFTPQQIAERLADALYPQRTNDDNGDEDGVSTLILATEALMFDAARRWFRDMQGQYRDDMAISVSKLN